MAGRDSIVSMTAFSVILAFFADAPVLGALESSSWISVKEAPVLEKMVNERAASGTSWFMRTFRIDKEICSARWKVAGLGVFDVYVNGVRVGNDFLKPGFTDLRKTKYAYSYDVTALLKTAAGQENVLAAEVSSGWWRDKIATPPKGRINLKSAFRAELELKFRDGTSVIIPTDEKNWKSGVAGPVMHAGIFDGEEYDARIPSPLETRVLSGTTEVNEQFKGEIFDSFGGEIFLREDLVLRPIEAYTWKKVQGASPNAYGRVVKERFFAPGESILLKKGEHLVVDFGQNCAAVPRLRFKSRSGAQVLMLPGEMLNDANGEKARRNDGPGGSIYRMNLRNEHHGMRVKYTFKGEKTEEYMPRFTFFGYRYIDVTATDDVQIFSFESVPVSSVSAKMEIGRLAVGDRSLNQFISNVYWGMLSNYLSVPTDCPQRNERLGWMADTQVFCEAGAYMADIYDFMRKYMKDVRDSQSLDGGFPSYAPFCQYGPDKFKLGWADAGVIVPWTMWKQFGDERIINENWEAMSKFVRRIDEEKYDFEGKIGYIFADWLSFDKYETCGNRYGHWGKWRNHPDAMNFRRFLAACYWLYDSRLMVEMALATQRASEADFFRQCEARALLYIRNTFLEKDGLLLKPMRDMQTACAFALKFGIVEGEKKTETLRMMIELIEKNGWCLATGFLGTNFLMDVLAEEGRFDIAYSLLLQHKNPSWLYSVDQGATTVWERWDSYTKEYGFGAASMNSFNHYAYGAVVGWVYRHVAGICSSSSAPGFKKIVLSPNPSRRIGWIDAAYKTKFGIIESSWKFTGEVWEWSFTIPEGTSAEVIVPGDAKSYTYLPGRYTVRRKLP